jgi:hypothetical protein
VRETSCTVRDTAPLEGRYANYFEVGHNAFEFLIDFGQLFTETEKAQLHTRIVTSPRYARAFLDTLGEAIEQYEQTFGEVHWK